MTCDLTLILNNLNINLFYYSFSMKKLYSLLLCFLACALGAKADVVVASTTEPGNGRPEHVYTMFQGNGYYANSLTAPTQTPENYGQFAFYAVDGLEDTYYIYSYKANKWLSYTKAASYSNRVNFIAMTDDKTDGAYFKVVNYSGDYYQMAPYNSTGVAAKYLNWFQGIGSNPVDGTNTFGLWEQGGSQDAGSRWTFTEIAVHTYTMVLPDGVTISIGGTIYSNGDTYTQEGSLSRDQITLVVGQDQFATISINDVAHTVTVNVANIPAQADKAVYDQAVIYPAQQTAVGAAAIEVSDNVYTLSNNVLAASFMKVGDALYFAGSKAMNLEAGTEPFTIAFGNGDNVPASAMTMSNLRVVSLVGSADSVGGAEHFDGKALEADYDYTYNEKAIKVLWRAVLRDGSHYLRTEMVLTGVDSVDMFNVIPMIYNVDTRAAGSTPAVVGNTRGAVLMSDKIFAGLENPVGYNTVGDATGEEDKYELAETLDETSFAAADWTQVAEADVPNRVTEAIGKAYPNIYAITKSDVTLEANQKVEITVEYTGGNHRLNFGGADLLDATGSTAASDYHSGYSGNQHSNNTFTFVVPADGTYTLRVIAENASETIDATSKMSVNVYNPKAGVVINTDVVGIQGRWSRNTTLNAGETWKISAVVGLIAQDGEQANANIHKTQKRRSFLAYSERERAVPWRPYPVYITWYELNINRNNAADPTQNMNANQVIDVLNNWKTNFYDRYGVGPNSFVLDDGWDNYGLWTFHAGFPNELRDIAALAAEMGSGVGAWLGPVGGYGTSGNYRRAYWNAEGRGGMQLSNPAYYQTFLDAAANLTQNNGDYRFFKFDGISAQFSSVGPDAGDTGNENAEGIIRLERYVRENLKRDIFFNTTVGTWASPFWYHYTDATWRQENDYGTIGNNSIDRENWITYRDRLVYQNYVTNSPICPINTLMTHGFILSNFGNVSSNKTYEATLREMRCAFLCGSGLVELYNDYALMNSINNGQLWADLAECISWQKRNADVLPDAHWVGGNPWTGSAAQVYGWAAWNGKKATLALRNGANDAQDYTFTLREALNIPANVSGSIIFRKSFGVQDALTGLAEGEPISIDQELTVSLPGSTVFAFDGLNSEETLTTVTGIALSTDSVDNSVEVGKTLVVKAIVTPATANFPALEWTSSNPEVATVSGGLVKALTEGTTTITASAIDGSGIVQTIVVTVTPKYVGPYALNFDKSQTPTRTDRSIANFSLTSQGGETQTINIGFAKPYIDLTEVDSAKLVCETGDTLTATLNMNGTWMNAYVYIDLDNDQQFSFNEGSTDQSGTDVMSFSFYNGVFASDEAGVNSAGTSLSGQARNTRVLPPFTAPEAAGEYRIRYKLDWNSIDPGGQVAADGTCTGSNGFLANGGSIVDAILKVNVATSVGGVQMEQNGREIYDLSGRRLQQAPRQGVFILNGKKVVK